MKRKIFSRFFAVTLVAVLAMFFCGVVAVAFNADVIVKENLQKETELLCSLLKSEADFTSLKRYSEDDSLRVTVIAADGAVLFESDVNAELENHGEREEIKNAINGSPVAVKRYSKTFSCNMTYYALKTKIDGDAEVVVRLAVKSSEIGEYLGVALPFLIGVLVLSLVASVVASNAIAKKVSDKVSEIGVSLKSLNDGDYRQIKTDSSEPELYSVLSEINELNKTARERIAGINAERDKLDTLIENVSQSIIALDENGRIAFANENAFNLFSSTSDVVEKDLVFLVDDLALAEKITGLSGENGGFEHRYKDKDLSVVVRKIEREYDKSEVSSIVIITDVTAERRLEKQKSDFFANASHELKTPVTVTLGLSELLLAKDGLDDGTRKQLERIHAESARLASLIADMLKLSSLESDEARQECVTDVDLRAVLEETVFELSEEIEKRKITSEISGNATVKADGAYVFEICRNLVSNAVHYNIENGKIKIEIKDEGNAVLLVVSDTGIGVPKDKLSRLCERFYRVDKSRSKKTGGTGLGLAIVKHACSVLGAELGFFSEEGCGLTATVLFKK